MGLASDYFDNLVLKSTSRLPRFACHGLTVAPSQRGVDQAMGSEAKRSLLAAQLLRLKRDDSAQFSADHRFKPLGKPCITIEANNR